MECHTAHFEFEITEKDKIDTKCRVRSYIKSTDFTFLEDYVTNVYLPLGQGHTVTIYTKFSQMGHICIRLLVHDIFYLPILLSCMIPIKNVCVFYCATFMQSKKKLPYN